MRLGGKRSARESIHQSIRDGKLNVGGQKSKDWLFKKRRHIEKPFHKTHLARSG